MMKRLMRRLVRGVNALAIMTVCDTYGDTSELHPGPCSRCVGHAVVDAAQSHVPGVGGNEWMLWLVAGLS